MADIDFAYVKAELTKVCLFAYFRIFIFPYNTTTHHLWSSPLTLGAADPENADTNSVVHSKRFGTFGVRGAPGGDCFLRFSRERYQFLQSAPVIEYFGACRAPWLISLADTACWLLSVLACGKIE